MRFNNQTWVLPSSRLDRNARNFPSGLQRGWSDDSSSEVIGTASPPAVATIQMRDLFSSSFSDAVETV